MESLGDFTKKLNPLLFNRLDPKRFLTTWLGTIVLAVNLFGWTVTSSLPEIAPSPPSDSVVAMFDDSPICEHATGHKDDDGGHRDDGGHGKMVCPACFPLGNASSGALVTGPSAVPVPVAPVVVDRIPPTDRIIRSPFDPHRYQARAPPQAA